MKSRLLGAVISLLALNANAAIIDFEEFQSSAPLDVSVIGDLEFSRCYYPRGSSSCVTTGIPVFDVSSLYSGINLASSGVMGAEITDGLTIRAENGSSFDFLSAYFGMTHPFDNPINIFEGIRNSQVIYSANIVPGQSPTLYQLNWLSIDEIRVSSQFQTGYFVVDDIQYSMSAIPIPPALYLFASGLIGLVGVARNKSTSLS